LRALRSRMRWPRTAAMKADVPGRGEPALERQELLSALVESEESDLDAYKRAETDPDLDAEAKELIHDVLLPETRAHLPALERLLQTV
jgi:hypothetical protein